MYDRVVAQERIDDLVRGAEAYRRAKGARAARVRERRGTLARVRGTVLSAVLWPVKH